ncbi:hypothetical protein L9F63_020500, partial [Diploptera punctata]
NTSDQILNEINNKILIPLGENMPGAEEGIENICRRTRYAYMISSYLFMGIRKHRHLKCNIMALPRASVKEFYSIALTKNSPYIDLFNY